MNVPATIETYQKYLFADREEMKRDHLQPALQDRLIRLREVYTYWANFPRLREVEIVKHIGERYGIKRTVAYEDLRIVKYLLGNLTRSSKDYYRYRFIEMYRETFEMARLTKDAKAMASALNAYGKYCQLDKEDVIERGYDQILIQPFVPTDDPSVIGIKPVPNIREKIVAKIQQYWSDDIEDVDIEAPDYNLERLIVSEQAQKIEQEAKNAAEAVL